MTVLCSALGWSRLKTLRVPRKALSLFSFNGGWSPSRRWSNRGHSLYLTSWEADNPGKGAKLASAEHCDAFLWFVASPLSDAQCPPAFQSPFCCLIRKRPDILEIGREIICYGKLILTFRDTNFVNIKPRVGSFVWIREGTVIPARHFPAHRHSGLRPAAQRHPEGEFSSWLKHNQHTSVTGMKVHGTSGVRRHQWCEEAREAS